MSPRFRSACTSFAIAVSFCFAMAASAAPLAYVSNEGSASVSVVDTGSNAVVATFKVGGKPRGIALSLDGKAPLPQRSGQQRGC